MNPDPKLENQEIDETVLEAEQVDDENVEMPETEDGSEDGDFTETAEEEGEGQEVALIEWEDDDGNVYEVPETLKSSLMKDKDYRQKTQAVAQKRKEIEAREAELEVLRQRDEEDLKLAGQLQSIEEQLKAYENVDWEALEQNDPDNAARHFRQRQLLKDRKQDLAAASQQRAQERLQAAQQSVAKRLEQTEQWVNENIPNWGLELMDDLREYATQTVGWELDDLQQAMSPQVMKMLYDGFTGHQVKKKATNLKGKAKSKVVPLKTVNAKSGKTTRTDLSTADMDAYVQARKRGVGG